ncbi:MAG: hypothetical protein P4L83_21720 [Nevskia sp.]|nr:hypothetical protein [Nevskia sp.]
MPVESKNVVPLSLELSAVSAWRCSRTYTVPCVDAAAGNAAAFWI